MKETLVILIAFNVSVWLAAGCAFDSWHNRDGTPKRPLQTDTGETNRVTVEMPGVKGN